jgi:hypothetical protein
VQRLCLAAQLVIGEGQTVTLVDWFAAEANNNGKEVVSGDGRTASDDDIGRLVDAMVGFTQPAAGQTTLPTALANQLSGHLTANWHQP